MSKTILLDAIHRDQRLAEERHRNLLSGARCDDDLLAEAMAEEARDASLAELVALAELAETGALAEFAELAELGETAELAEMTEIAELAGTDLFAELAETRTLAEMGGLAELAELAESSALAELRAEAGMLTELAEVIDLAELAELAEMPAAGPLRCPRDGALLQRIDRENMHVDLCSTCGGMWFDWGELEAMVGKHLGIEIPAFARDTDLRCPRCSGQMCVYKLPEEGVDMEKWTVEIDQCRDCEGVWLDRSELEQIKASRQGKGKKGFLKRFLDKVLG